MEDFADKDRHQGGDRNEGFIRPPAGQGKTARRELPGPALPRTDRASMFRGADPLSAGPEKKEPIGASLQQNWQQGLRKWTKGEEGSLHPGQSPSKHIHRSPYPVQEGRIRTDAATPPATFLEDKSR